MCSNGVLYWGRAPIGVNGGGDMLGENGQLVAVSANLGNGQRNIGNRIPLHGNRLSRATVGSVPGHAYGACAVEAELTPLVHTQLATTILIVDDCTLYRESLAAVLGEDDSFEACVAWDMTSLLTALENGTPDVILLNMSTKDSTQLLRTITSGRPDARVVAVGVWEGDEPTIVACAEAGVTGYHLRSESFDDLLSLMNRVANGESVCSPSVATILLRRLSALASESKPDPGELVLTTREIQILRMLELGLSNREIANDLCIALHTVKNHVHSILGKLGVRTRTQAVAVSRSLHTAG